MSPIAIVTASDSGIGQSAAKELAEKGFDVGITYHKDEVGARETLRAVEGVGRWLFASLPTIPTTRVKGPPGND